MRATKNHKVSFKDQRQILLKKTTRFIEYDSFHHSAVDSPQQIKHFIQTLSANNVTRFTQVTTRLTSADLMGPTVSLSFNDLKSQIRSEMFFARRTEGKFSAQILMNSQPNKTKFELKIPYPCAIGSEQQIFPILPPNPRIISLYKISPKSQIRRYRPQFF